MNKEIAPSPKAQVLENTRLVSAHHEIVGHPLFDDMANLTLLHYIDQCTRNPEEDPGANFYRILGAKEFLQSLKTIGFGGPSPTVRDRDNLNHRV